MESKRGKRGKRGGSNRRKIIREKEFGKRRMREEKITERGSE